MENIIENIKKEQSPEKEKPSFLYHGSPHKIEELEPRTKPRREKEEGKLIYATSKIEDASMFMAEGLGLTGHFVVDGESVPHAIIVSDRGEFLKRDRGGNIHILPGDGFKPSPHEGMSNEWASKERVKPVKVLEYNSALDAMLENGVQVYFVDEATYQQIRNAKDHGYSILKNLESENKRRSTNIKF